MTDKYAEPSEGVDRYAVLGNPIGHSKSPQIHAAFAKQTNQDISYEAILVSLDGFEAKVHELIMQGYKGVNVTVPFKFEAFAMCDNMSESARFAGAVNTLTFYNGVISGYNTDGMGLVIDIKSNLKHGLEGAQILLLGAGGAAQGVLRPLLESKPASLVVANRTVEKAQLMVNKISDSHVIARDFDSLNKQVFDIVINATSTGLTDTTLPVPNTIFAKDCLAYDMMYGRETPFIAQARKAGAKVADGLGMLVEQAAEAFYIWRGVRPETRPVIKLLRNSN